METILIVQLLGALLGLLAVVFGAFGAHTLKKSLSEAQLKSFETGVKYQMYHSLALILLGILMIQFQHKYLNYASYSFLIGTIIFSGSLYILCATGISKLGAITPIGGVFLIAAWVLLAIGVAKSV